MGIEEGAQALKIRVQHKVNPLISTVSSTAATKDAGNKFKRGKGGQIDNQMEFHPRNKAKQAQI